MSGESLDEPSGALVQFAPTSGRVLGVLGIVVSAAVVVLGIVDPGDVIAPVMIAAAAAGVVAWAALLRPRVSVNARTLYLRNMLETVEVPLAAIDEVVIRQVLAVRVGEKKFVSPSIGRKLRKMIKAPRPAQLMMPDVPESMPDVLGPAPEAPRTQLVVDYADHVESTLRGLVEDARLRQGITRYSDEALALAADVRRRPAWLEIGALTALVVAFVASVLV